MHKRRYFTMIFAMWTSVLFLLTITCLHFTQAITSGCHAEIDTIYGISWPSVNSTAAANINVSSSCSRGSGNATRICNSDGKWESPIVTNCSSYEFSNLINLIGSRQVSDFNHLAAELAKITNMTEADISLYPNDLMDVNSVLQFLVIRTTEILSLQEETDIIQNIIDSFSNALSPKNNPGWIELQKTNPGESQTLLMNAERFGLYLAEDFDETEMTQTYESENIVIEAKLVNINSTEDFEFWADNNSVTISADSIQQQCTIKGFNLVPVVGMNVKNIENLLPVNDEMLTAVQPISEVLSTQVTNVSSLDSAIHLTFQYSTKNLNNSSLMSCGYWNFSMNNGRGGWDTEGVTVVSNDVNNSTITCLSTHLASFVVLEHLSVDQNEDATEQDHSSVHVVSYIGCSISLACLLVTAFALVYYRKNIAVFTGIHGYIHLNLVITLIVALVIFISGTETATNNKAACEAVAILIHYFFTAAFSWLLCESILFFSIATSNSFIASRREIFYTILGWGIPIPIVVITAGVAHDQFGHDDFCWIDTEENVFWGVFASVMALFMVNLILLILSFCLLCMDNKSDDDCLDPYVMSLMKGSTTLLLLLGITWTFSILAVNQESSVFDWFFATFISLQGILIFIFYVFNNEMNKEKMMLCCRCILPI